MIKKSHGGARRGAGHPNELGESKLISVDLPLSLLVDLDEEVQARKDAGEKATRNKLIREFIGKGLKKGEKTMLDMPHIDLDILYRRIAEKHPEWYATYMQEIGRDIYGPVVPYDWQGWLKKEHPEAYRETRKAMQCEYYIAHPPQDSAWRTELIRRGEGPTIAQALRMPTSNLWWSTAVTMAHCDAINADGDFPGYPGEEQRQRERAQW